MTKARILSPTSENIARAAEALRTGDVVGMPTETVYGLAGDALNPDALTKIFSAKERPTFDPLIVHLAPPMAAGESVFVELKRSGLVNLAVLSAEALKRLENLVSAFWPGPLTMVLPKLPVVPDLATSGLPTVALRMPRHPVAQALIREAGVPLAAPSANRFGRISPTSASDVEAELGDRISWILDGGQCEIGLESTVVAMTSNGALTLLRPGGISRSEIERVAGSPLQAPSSALPRSAPGLASAPGMQAPGMLDSHYAPRKPLHLLPRSARAMSDADWRSLGERVRAHLSSSASIGLLLQQGVDASESDKIIFSVFKKTTRTRVLSPKGDLGEAAKNLFAFMRELDNEECSVILAEPCESDQGLGHAIADRMRRASHRG